MPSLDLAYRPLLSFGSLTEVLAVLVILQCVQIDVCCLTSQLFYLFSESNVKVHLYFPEANLFGVDFWV